MDEAEWIEKNKEKLQKHAELRLKKQKEKLAKVVGRLRKSSSTLIDRAVLFSYANSDGSNKQEVERAKHKRKEEKECGGVADTRLLAEEEKRKELLGHVSSDLMQHPLWVGFEEHSADVCDDVAMFKNQVAGLRARNLAKRDELKELRLSMKELCKVEKEVQVGSELWKVNRPFGVGKKNKKKAIGGGEIKREGGRKGELEKNKSQEVGGEVKGNIGGEVVDIEKLSFVSPGAL
ncbi:hypothetical protein TL16_g03762 [Triparma laevis f. inornata]|nr:hypothetical protein TL16_g03762 [Triparma laevis f. inornata]